MINESLCVIYRKLYTNNNNYDNANLSRLNPQGLFIGPIISSCQHQVLTNCILQSDSASQEEFLKEAGLMKRLKHDNLLHLLGVCSLQKPIFIITEYMPLGNLLEYIRLLLEAF